ncbi:MAG: hypothetical protein HY541_02785 [Deltaproteobacteria bacterium]|nr:hypothetical protein [Deltaproteobacteria bacterium]
MKSTARNWLLLFGICGVGCIIFFFSCGTDPGNPATRPTPGFGLISGQIDLDAEDLSAFSALELPASSIGSSIPALHLNLSAKDDLADEDSDILVLVTNSTGDSFLTVANDDGSFAVKARKGVASKLEFFMGDKYLATMVFGVDTKNPQTTDTFLIDNSIEDLDLGVVTHHGRWAVPEMNPLEPVDSDKDGDEFSDSSPEEEVYATIATIRSFTMEGKALNRDVNLDNFDEVTIIDSTINGHVSITNAEKVFIDPTSISSLSIADSASVILEEVTVESDLALDSIDDLKIIESRVAGNTSIQNVALGAIEDSEFEGEFATDDASASAVTETRNTRGKTGNEETVWETAKNKSNASHDKLAANAEPAQKTPDLAPNHKNNEKILLASRETIGNGATSNTRNNGNGDTRMIGRTLTATHPANVNSGKTTGASKTTSGTGTKKASSTVDTSSTATSSGMGAYFGLGLCLFLCFCLYLYLFFCFVRKHQRHGFSVAGE